MENSSYTIIITKDSDGYFVGTVPELLNCYSQGKTKEELLERIKEAIELCLEDEKSNNSIINRNEFIGVERIYL